MDAMYLSHGDIYSKEKKFSLYFYDHNTEYIYSKFPQYHDFYEIQFFESSTNSQEILARLTLGDETYSLYHNSVVLINLFERHKIEIISTDCRRRCFDISPEVIHFASSEKSNLLNILNQKNIHYPVCRMDNAQGDYIASLFQAFYNAKVIHSAEMYETGILFVFLSFLYDLFYDEQLPVRKEPKSMELVFSIVQYINTHISDSNLSLERISGELHFSRYYLCHIFKGHTNISLQKYIFDKKIELAKKLLPYHKTTEVSNMLGFNTYSSFFRVFKKNTGLSPSDFKNHSTGI